MSFLGGGGECSTAGNPLSQFAKHTQDDNSLQRDRQAQGGPQGGLGGFRNVPNHGPQDQMMNNFLQQNGQLPGMSIPEGMSQIRLDHPGQAVHLRANTTSPNWAHEFQTNPQAAMEQAFNAPPGTQFSPEDHARFAQMIQPVNSNRSSPMPAAMLQQQQQQQQQSSMMGMGMNMGMGPAMGMGMGMGTGMGMGMGMNMGRPMGGMYGGGLMQEQPMSQEQQADVKGKAKLVELDDHTWEEQFAQIALEDQQAREEEQQNCTVEEELNRVDEEVIGSETNLDGDFESIWRGIQAERFAAAEGQKEDDWNGQFSEEAWRNDYSNAWGDDLGRMGSDPMMGTYLFEDNNLFKGMNNPFQEGLRIIDQGGNLSLAALAFEAAVQRDPAHVEAWVQLGIAQAQNEKETAAIRSLEQAKRLDPNNLEALMTLAVSYTNEGYDSSAYRTLERWLSVKYPSIISPAEISVSSDVGFTERSILHARITDLFIKAANLSPGGELMDPDVQVGLGVLFYGDEKYDKAVDCFSASLASSEQGSSNQQSHVHLLWNRLGATLANSGRSEDALAAYEHALTLRPNFVRARYNLGVSCINMGCLAEAAGHLLSALAMHKSVENEGREKAREILGGQDVSDAQLSAMTTHNQSTNLYETLRRVFNQMDRRDLADKVVSGVDPEIFRGDVEF